MATVIILFIAGFCILIIAGGCGILIHGICRPRRKTYDTVARRSEPVDPAQLGLSAEPVHFTLSDNTKTPGWIIAGKNAHGPTVLIIHGFGDSRFGAFLWAPLVSEYAAQIVVFDMPGHGDSKAKNCSGGLREPKDVLKIIEQIASLQNSASGNKNIVLYGYSLGAQTAIATAALATKSNSAIKISGVIADGPYRYWDEPVKNFLRLRRYPSQPFVFVTWAVFYIFSKEFRNFDRAKKAAQMNCPLLVLHGTDDELCPHASGKQIAEAAAIGTFVSFAGGHHLDLIALAPQLYEQSLARFFNSLDNKNVSGCI